MHRSQVHVYLCCVCLSMLVPCMFVCAFVCVIFTQWQMVFYTRLGLPSFSCVSAVDGVPQSHKGSMVCAHSCLCCEHICLCWFVLPMDVVRVWLSAVSNAVSCVTLTPPLVCGTCVVTMLGHAAYTVRLCGHIHSQHSLSSGRRGECFPSCVCTQRS